MTDQVDDDDQVCEDCDGDGWVYRRIDVDAEKAVPCHCGLGDDDE